MKIFAPDYYEKFKCIADKCRHSCCIGWEIYIDGATYEKYKALDNPIKDELLSSIENSSEGIRFKQSYRGRCPMLSECGLCRLITAVGEEMLSDICRLHPRFICDKGKRREIGLGLACEEAARLALLGEEYPRLVEIGECEGAEEECGYDSLKIRDSLVSILSMDVPLLEKLRLAEKKFGVTTSIHTNEEWISLFSSLEILDSEWREILDRVSGEIKRGRELSPLSKRNEEICSKFMIYLASRHIFAADSEPQARAAVGFSLLGGKILALLISTLGASEEDAVMLARLYSSEIEYSESNTDEIFFEFQADF